MTTARGGVAAIVLAGGSSRRMGPGRDKLCEIVAGRPLLVHSLLSFDRCPVVDEIVLVARADRRAAFKAMALRHGVRKLARVVAGGIERQDSVWRGLLALSPSVKIVLIHDGARCCVTPGLIARGVRAARAKGAAIPAARVSDTIKRAGADLRVAATLDRAELWAAQTPQTFRADLIRRAYRPLIRQGIVVTDDAAAVERLGHPVWIVASDPANLKVTTPADLRLAATLLARDADPA